MAEDIHLQPEADARQDLRTLLDLVEAAPPVEAVDVLARELARIVDADDVTFLIADFSGDALIRFLSTPNGVEIVDDDGQKHLATVPLVGSPHEHAIRAQQVQVVASADSARLYAPVTDRGDALGVLELSLPSMPNDDTMAFVASAAHALAYVIIANRRHTDLFERGQRNRPFSLAAEIQRRLLPDAFTCEAAEFTLAGWLEPASNVGGDTFDYSVERDALHLSISDAMGHTVNASQLATLAVGSLRNSRRARAGIAEKASVANSVISEHAQDDEFVSSLLLDVDLTTGSVVIINAGHPNPYLVRNGVTTEVKLHADIPLGLFLDTEYLQQTMQLEPGDRLVLVTDGMLERNASALDITSALQDMTALHPREVVHTFARAVVKATDGALQDDATVLCVDWYGRNADSRDRISNAGATQFRASQPLRDA